MITLKVYTTPRWLSIVTGIGLSKNHTEVRKLKSDSRRSIDTIVTLEVEQYLKGSFGSTLQFRVPGGELGRFRSVVVGAPEFAADDRVVVFLGARGPSVPYVLGLSQGVFRVVRGDDGWAVTPPPVFPATSGNTPLVRGSASRRPMPLADFEQRVRALARGAL